MGRPPLAEQARLSAQLNLRLRAADLAAVQQAARRAALTPVEWVRRLALEAAGQPPAPGSALVEEMLRMREHLSTVGVTLVAALRTARRNRKMLLEPEHGRQLQERVEETRSLLLQVLALLEDLRDEER